MIKNYMGLRVLCKNYICGTRGNLERCYMHFYVNCPSYKAWEREADKMKDYDRLLDVNSKTIERRLEK